MRLLSVGLAAALALCIGCVWQPVVYDEPAQEKASAAVAAFESDARLNRFFQESVAYAVFPDAFRAGTGFGGAFGTGWLFESGDVSARVTLFEAFAGADLGAQVYRSIIFFRTEAALKDFTRGNFEFTGQANAAHVVGGQSLTPAYHPDVALFVQVKGGLLLEASVGAQRYDVFPLAESSLSGESE